MKGLVGWVSGEGVEEVGAEADAAADAEGGVVVAGVFDGVIALVAGVAEEPDEVGVGQVGGVAVRGEGGGFEVVVVGAGGER